METPGQPTPAPGTPPAPTPPTPPPTPAPPPAPAPSAFLEWIAEADKRDLVAQARAGLGIGFRTATVAEVDELLELPTAERPNAIRTLRARGALLPVAGGDGNGGGSGGEGGSGEGGSGEGGSGSGSGSGGGSGGQGSGSGSGQGGSGGGSGGSGSGGSGDGWTPPSREDWERTQRSAADNAREAREAKRELAEATGKGETAEQKLERVGGVLKGNAIKSTAAEVARDLGVKSPSIAHRLIDRTGLDVDLDLDGEDPKATVSDGAKATIKARLEEAIKEAPELAGGEVRRQLPGGGNNDAAGTTGGGNEAMNNMLRRAAGKG